MRTTIRLSPTLLAEAKRFAVETDRTLTAVIEDALQQALTRRHASPKRPALRLPVDHGHGLLPGVDLDNSAALLDRMEQNDPA